MGLNITLTRNGPSGFKSYPIKNIRIFSSANIRKAILQSATINIHAVLKEFKREIYTHLRGSFRAVKKTYPGQAEEASLQFAYLTALKQSHISQTGSGVSLRALNLDTMDNMTPMSPRSKTKRTGGWWRMHESGVAGRVGASNIYGFMPEGVVRVIFGDRADDIIGKHDEGFMIDLRKEFGKRMLNSGIVKPFPGFTPKRILTRVLDQLDDFRPQFREKIVETAVASLAGGA